MDKVTNKAEKAGDKVQNKAEKAGDKVQNKAEKVRSPSEQACLHGDVAAGSTVLAPLLDVVTDPQTCLPSLA